MTYGSSIFTSWFQIIYVEVNEVNLSLSYGGVGHVKLKGYVKIWRKAPSILKKKS